MGRSAEFICVECGAAHGKWSGRCDACGAWNSLREESRAANAGPLKGKNKTSVPRAKLLTLDSEEAAPVRRASGIAELDRVLGGGLAESAAVLIGGDPGIGKSTLLLQAATGFANGGAGVVYISGEEAPGQVRMRAKRLGLNAAPLNLAAETDLRAILAMLETERPDIVVIDSIQTMWADSVEAAPGSVSQVRAAAHELTAFAKRRGAAVLLVGHVTKDGQLAGPRVVEHMVDAVLYFEGERGHQFRILRAVKNRFGPADEIGVFEMTGAGLAEVSNPSLLFLGERGDAAPGSVVFAGMEGTRPLLCEIQALVAQSPLGTPRRAVIGWDASRLAMILAVLEARVGLSFAGADVYLNVAGGLRISEPAADLAVATALLSALHDQPAPAEAVFFGEVSLSGAVRPVAQAEARLKEASKLGFERAFAPAVSEIAGAGPETVEVTSLRAFVFETFGADHSE